MAFNLSSPVAKLAFEMALKNQQAIDSGGQFDAQARGFVSKALATGNDPLAPFEDIYRQYVDPAEASRRAQAEAFNAYLVGLPELLAQSQKELEAQRKAGSSKLDWTNLSGQRSASDSLNQLLNMILPATPPGAKPQTRVRRPIREEDRVNNETLRARAL